MAIGLITNPITWLNGTVLTPTWAQTVQDNINAWINGVNTIGANSLTGAATSTTTPTPAFSKNTLYGDILPLAWGVYKNGSGFTAGANVSSFVRNSAGNFTITLITNATNTDTIMAIPGVSNAAGTRFDYQVSVTGLSTFDIYTSVGGVATDATRTYFVAYGF